MKKHIEEKHPITIFLNNFLISFIILIAAVVSFDLHLGSPVLGCLIFGALFAYIATKFKISRMEKAVAQSRHAK